MSNHPSERPTWTSAGSLQAVLLGLASGGVCLAAVSPRRRCALTAPFHPCLCAPHVLTRHRRCVSVALSRGFPRVGFPTTLPCDVRTFLEGDTSAAAWPARSSVAHAPARWTKGGRCLVAARSAPRAACARPHHGAAPRAGWIGSAPWTSRPLVTTISAASPTSSGAASAPRSSTSASWSSCCCSSARCSATTRRRRLGLRAARTAGLAAVPRAHLSVLLGHRGQLRPDAGQARAGIACRRHRRHAPSGSAILVRNLVRFVDCLPVLLHRRRDQRSSRRARGASASATSPRRRASSQPTHPDDDRRRPRRRATKTSSPASCAERRRPPARRARLSTRACAPACTLRRVSSARTRSPRSGRRPRTVRIRNGAPSPRHRPDTPRCRARRVPPRRRIERPPASGPRAGKLGDGRGCSSSVDTIRARSGTGRPPARARARPGSGSAPSSRSRAAGGCGRSRGRSA